MARKIERVKVTCDKLNEMADTIRRSVRGYNPESGQADEHVYTNDGVNGYIIQSNNIVLHRADGSLKKWHI